MAEWPKASSEEITGRLGVHLVGAKVHQDLKWIFRETSSTDLGIDGEIEIREKDSSSHGRRLSLQIKCGASYLREESDSHFIYRGDYKHLRYWVESPNPVVLILCDPESNQCWWQHADISFVNFHELGWSIAIPKLQTLSLASIDKLNSVANLFQKKDLIKLLLRDWFGWRFEHKIQFASDFAIPRDYHWFSMLAQTATEYLMIDFLMAGVDGFPLVDIADMEYYAGSNYRVFGYKHFVLAFVSESLHHLEKIPAPCKIDGVTIQFIPFLLKRRNMELNEVGKDNQIIESWNYEVESVDPNYVGSIERNIKWSGTEKPCI